MFFAALDKSGGIEWVVDPGIILLGILLLIAGILIMLALIYTRVMHKLNVSQIKKLDEKAQEPHSTKEARLRQWEKLAEESEGPKSMKSFLEFLTRNSIQVDDPECQKLLMEVSRHIMHSNAALLEKPEGAAEDNEVERLAQSQIAIIHSLQQTNASVTIEVPTPYEVGPQDVIEPEAPRQRRVSINMQQRNSLRKRNKVHPCKSKEFADVTILPVPK